MGFSSIAPIEDLVSFHEKATKKTGEKLDGVNYADYLKIQNIQKKDIPEMVAQLQGYIDYAKKDLEKSPNDPNKQSSLKKWEDSLKSVIDLGDGWNSGRIKIEKHREEVYEKTVSMTESKLKELFGEVKKIASTQASVKSTVSASNILTSISEGEGKLLEQKLQNIQSKLDEYAKSKGLESIVINKIAGNPSNRGIDSLVVTVTEKVQPPRINGKIYLFDGILLRGSIMSTRMKTDDELVKEIIQKIEERNTSPQEDSTSLPPSLPQVNKPQKGSERREVTDDEILERNKKYITKYRINCSANPILQSYIDDPTREYIMKLQDVVKYPGKKDGIMGPITKKAIEDYLKKNESGDQAESPLNTGNISFSRDGGRVLLNARDPSGTTVQKLSYEDILALARKGGENGDKMSKEMKGEYNQLALLSTIADIWIQSASKHMESLIGGSFRDGDKKKYQNSINEVTQHITKLQTDLKSGTSIQGTLLSDTPQLIARLNRDAGRFEAPIAINDLEKALSIVQEGGSTFEQKRAKILKQLSTVFDTGVTEGVQTTAMAEVAKMTQFNNLKTKLADPKFMDEFVSGINTKEWYPNLQKVFGLSENDAKKLAKELLEVRNGMDAQVNTIKKALSEKGATTTQLDDQVKGAKNMALQMVISKYIINTKIDTLPAEGYVDAYKTASRDLTTNKIIDIATQMAISLVPMGGGLLAVRGVAAAGAKLATGSGKLAQGINALSGTGWKAGAARMVGEGTLFYEGFNLTNNLLRNQDTENKLGGAFEGWDNGKEILKNIAMIGVINRLSLNTSKPINFLADKPKLQAFTQETLKALGIGGVVVGTSFTIDGIAGAIDPASSFEGGINPSWEEYAQAVVMTALFRKFGNKNKVEASKKSTEKGSTLSHSNTTDLGAKARIEEMHGIGRASVDHGYEVTPRSRLTTHEQLELKEKIRQRTGNSKNTLEILSKKESKILDDNQKVKTKKSEDIPKTINPERQTRDIGAKEPSIATHPAVQSEIGSKIQKTPEKIFRGLRDAQDGGAKVKALENAMNTNKLGGKPTLQDLRISHQEVSKVETGKDPEFTQAKNDLLSYLDSQIALKTPKQSFTSMDSARKWINEHPKTAIAGTLIAIGGVVYMLVDKQGSVVPEAPQAGTGAIDSVGGVVTGGIIEAKAGETTIAPPANTARTGTIGTPK